MICEIIARFITHNVIHVRTCCTWSSARIKRRRLWRVCCEGDLKTRQCDCVSAGLSVCGWEGNVVAWRAVNLSSTCSLLSGAGRWTSSTTYPIIHIYFFHPGVCLVWQSMAQRKEKERKGLFVWDADNTSSISFGFCIFLCSWSSEGDQSLILAARIH